MINTETFYSPEDLSKKFRISLSSTYKLIRSGEIPSIRLGKVYRIPESDLLMFLKRKGKRSPDVPQAAGAFLKLLRSSPIRKRVRQVYLYGSYVRDDFDEDSDVDLCVIADLPDLKSRTLVSRLAEKAMEETDYRELLSIRTENFDSWERMRRENYPLVQNILREGIPLWKSP